LEGFPPIETIGMVKGLLLNPPYNVNGVDMDGIIEDWDSLPKNASQSQKGLGIEDSNASLLAKGNDGGI
jgi:hypothetical protein